MPRPPMAATRRPMIMTNNFTLRPQVVYAFPSRGPRKYHRIKPSSGSSTTAIIQINFFSLETELCKMLITAQISPASISRPQRPLYPMFIIFGSFRYTRDTELHFCRRSPTELSVY